MTCLVSYEGIIQHCITLCNNSCIGVWVRNLEGKTLYVSPGFTRTTGYDINDLPDSNAVFEKLLHASFPRTKLVNVLELGFAQSDVLIRCKDGECKYVELLGLSYKNQVKVLIVHEVSSQTEARAALEYSQRLLSLKSRLSEMFLTHDDSRIYNHVLDILLEGMQSTVGKIAIMDDLNTLKCLASELGETGSGSEAFGGDLSQGQWKSGIWQRIIKEQKTCACNRPLPVMENHIPLNRIIHAPMVVSGRVMGIISAANKKGEYSAQDKILFTSLANHIAPLMLARMEKEQEETRRKAIEQDLNDLNRELENRVCVRSAALMRSNEMLRQEIRERKQVEASLRESEERYCLAVQGTNDGIWERDILHNTVYLSSRLKAIIGYEDDELPNQINEWESRIHPEDIDHVLKTNSACIKSAGSSVVEYRLRHKDGTYRWIKDRGACLRDSNGRAVRMAGAITDISESKKVAREKKELERQLRHTSKLEALGTLTGGVAHDFNNLLQGMSSNIHLLLMRKGMDEKVDLCARDMDSIINRASELVAHLLAFSYRMDPEFRLVNINDVIEDSLQLLRSTLPKMICIESNLDADPGLIMADGTQLEQILLNLVTNARDAISGEGTICIETKKHVLDQERAAILGLEPGSYMRLVIIDTGCGIDDEIREHIFEPFFTTKTIGKGTGLGLSSVYGIVRRHEGAITCVDRSGQGTRFTLFFPVQSSKEGNIGSAEEHSDFLPTSHGNETILYVDDEELIAQAAGDVLTEYGYKVFLAGSGENALDLFETGDERIDLVVMDLGMPGMGGELCAQKILALKPDVHILITSGYRNHKLASAPEEYGLAGFLPKPFRMGALLQRIRGILGDDNTVPENLEPGVCRSAGANGQVEENAE